MNVSAHVALGSSGPLVQLRSMFARKFEQTQRTLAFQSRYLDETGNLQGLNDEELSSQYQHGDFVCMTLPDDRRVLMLITNLGNLVLFERYTNAVVPIVAQVPGSRLLWLVDLPCVGAAFLELVFERPQEYMQVINNLHTIAKTTADWQFAEQDILNHPAWKQIYG